MFGASFDIDPDASEAALVDQLAAMNRAASSIAAGQVRVTAMLEAKRQARKAAEGVPAAKRCQGLASEVGLARKASPWHGAKFLKMSGILVEDMPYTLAALESGVLTEGRAMIIADQADCLSPADRHAMDAELCADPDVLEGLGDRKVEAEAGRVAIRLDHDAVMERISRHQCDRTVTARPAPHGMMYLTALLTAAEGLTAYQALQAQAAAAAAASIAAGHGCAGRGALMADAFYRRVTGREVGAAVPVALNLVVSDESLLAQGPEPAVLQGYGPIPAAVARQMALAALLDPEVEAAVRKLYADPATGNLVAMESTARAFPKGLRWLIALRDQRCRTPYCDAPVRHIDHITRHADGGPTNAGNGQGLCERCNYAKESPGWQTATVYDRYGRHTTELTTPTGRTYRSTAPPQPTGARVFTNDIHVVRIHAAA
ncbi:HNH endonuclease signature motif containing protein [Mycolicibacterium sp. 050232]|uniref:HNH endonuclease signature motif containing protein n=1 Tax=Mycolicibacterium sp. 050232 TaxID=3113982 RepID=UPI002E29EB25|nr:HNH endonuclease signature motif containing protein [Mycolicibacterium sp. 050232]MED5815876.1 HNH endonuclease signature motif containing protein [Mycolicibacterium sp. 050232]